MDKNRKFIVIVRIHLGSLYKEQILFVGCLNLHQQLIREEVECHCLQNWGPAHLLQWGHALLNALELDHTIITHYIRRKNTMPNRNLCLAEAAPKILGFGWKIVGLSNSFPIMFSRTGWSGKPLFALQEFLFPIVLLYTSNWNNLNNRLITIFYLNLQITLLAKWNIFQRLSALVVHEPWDNISFSKWHD